ncbi:MAG: tetratricopeptide repeat protein [Steroidobacteraceae bacterium]|nr:tetratricopeptide repeat protein [Steroidobacteraceae bacterium]
MESASAPTSPAAPASAEPGAAPAQPQLLPKRALADFDRAVNLMRAGNTTEAELEFKQLTVAYPQLAAPRVNLALLQRKAGRLDEAQATLESAVEANATSALAWNELGLTLRMQGKFQDAAQAYERAIAADPNYAPAHRNFGVLLDLYLGDPERALTEFERYKELTGEDKPVTGWIAELRQRTGKPAAPRPPTEGTPGESAPAEGAPHEEPAPNENAVPVPSADSEPAVAAQGE